METKINELKSQILERQWILNWLVKEQRFPISAYNSLARELKNWKVLLAELEHMQIESTYKMIKSN
jgi:hypothetical protein